ncbi:hypothetical protein N7456_007285 [Penicillium angulare]|uniref:Uncharacterized protein n=1 Tax=Penicillium angulare TaxID=116970 RepID=A0A9W9FAF8_9EURO|nr:hypothetical protein N7456_007285 [Penicillium angulare]
MLLLLRNFRFQHGGLNKVEPRDESRLIVHLQPPQSDFHITTWSPGDQLLRNIAPQGQYRDSQANIYGLAIWLHRNGRSNCIVADDLTKRQLSGGPIRGENMEISVIKLAAGPDAGEKVRNIAQRSAITNDENIALLEAVKTFEVGQRFLMNRSATNPSIYLDYGIQLHDADKRIFSADVAGSLGHEGIQVSRCIERELAASTPLPAELVLDVASRANNM